MLGADEGAGRSSSRFAAGRSSAWRASRALVGAPASCARRSSSGRVVAGAGSSGAALVPSPAMTVQWPSLPRQRHSRRGTGRRGWRAAATSMSATARRRLLAEEELADVGIQPVERAARRSAPRPALLVRRGDRRRRLGSDGAARGAAFLEEAEHGKRRPVRRVRAATRQRSCRATVAPRSARYTRGLRRFSSVG